MSHTPGPWTVEVGESSGPGMGSDIVRVDVVKGDQRIAGVTVRPGSRAVSNADLIAAAPNLLAALEAAVAWGERHGEKVAIEAGLGVSEWEACTPPWWTTARDAVAKATGLAAATA